MKRLPLIILFTLFVQQGKSCYCEAFWPAISREALKEFDFVSTFKILDIKSNTKDSTNKSYVICVASIEIYKGVKHIKEIIVQGNSFHNGVSNSCDLMMRKNDVWLLFGKMKNDAYTIIGNICQRHELIEFFDGSKPSSYWFGNKRNQTISLNILYSKKVRIKQQEKTYYPNNSVESVQQYKNNLLHGKQLVFYPNYNMRKKSIKRFELNYNLGKLHGKVYRWNDQGELCYIENYHNGIKHDTSIIYYPIDTLEVFVDDYVRKEKLSRTKVVERLIKPSPRHIEIYDSQGSLMAEYSYYLNGKASHETIYDINGNGTYRYFDINGKLEREY